MNYTILIVDDDMAINDMLVKYLRKNGYITYSAYSGTEALLFLEKQKVNLIILDLMLPGLSGEQVLAEIKKTKNVPVIGLSAKEDSKSKIFLLKNGADDYVTKPFDIEELLARIETILRRIYENQYELYERKVTMQELHAAIASLPNKQAKRIYAHFILGMTKQDIARAEGVHEKVVRVAIERGLRHLEKILKNSL